MLKDFRTFLSKGNAIDLAVGLVVGGAFMAIIKSFVDELIIPLTGILGKVDFSNLYVVIKGVVPDGAALTEARKVPGAVVLGYGQFVTVTINTLILAFAVFLTVQALNRLRARVVKEEPPAPPPPEIALLTEIRDALKSR